MPGSPTRRLASRQPLLYTSFPGLCLNRRIHSDNCYLLNYLLHVRKRQSRWPSQPCPPPGLVWSGLEETPAPRGGGGIRARWPWGQLWCEWGHCRCSRRALCWAKPRAEPCVSLCPQRPQGPGRVRTSSQRPCGLGSPMCHCSKLGRWPQSPCSSVGPQGSPLGCRPLPAGGRTVSTLEAKEWGGFSTYLEKWFCFTHQWNIEVIEFCGPYFSS